MSEQVAVAPRGRWQIGAYTFTRYSTAQRGGHRWGCQARGKGVDFHRTPVGAFIALWKWQSK